MDFFKKIRHGGRSNRNFYIPEWSRFREICAAWDERLKSRWSTATELPPGGRPQWHLPGGGEVTQTYKSNLQLKTCMGRPRKEKAASLISTATSPPQARGQRPLDAALMAAERRWTTTLTTRFAHLPVTHSEIIHRITPALQEAATQAEMRQPGSGLEYLMTQLGLGTANE